MLKNAPDTNSKQISNIEDVPSTKPTITQGLKFTFTYTFGTPINNYLNHYDYFNWITPNLILGSIPLVSNQKKYKK